MCLANRHVGRWNGGTVCENLVILTYKVHDMMLWLRAAETWRFKERLLKYLSHTQKMWQSVHNKVSRLENSNKMWLSDIQTSISLSGMLIKGEINQRVGQKQSSFNNFDTCCTWRSQAHNPRCVYRLFCLIADHVILIVCFLFFYAFLFA